MIYAGIGSRETPPEYLARMKIIGGYFALAGFTLRSGGATGADAAFEEACIRANGKREIFEPFDTKPEWYEMAARFHPAWSRLSDYAKALHARNSAIVFGALLDTRCDFIVCWTPNGEVTGGTGQAMRIANYYKIPIFNLALPDAEREMWNSLNVK